MTVENHTIRLLQEVRKDVADVRKDVADVRMQVETNGQGLEHAAQERSALRQHLRHMEIRISTEIKDVAGAVLELKGLVVQSGAIRARVDDHEQRLLDLEDT